MIHIDLFSGIGGFALAARRVGWETVAFCDNDPWCRRVLEKHWPGVPKYDDVTTLTADRLRADGLLQRRPICLTAGFPCQDISYAGTGAGLDGARSGLWSEVRRLVGDVRPDVVVLENVAALLGRGLDRVAGDLAAIGYDLEWHCIPASTIGAPHRRDRWWGIAYPHSHGLRLEPYAGPSGEEAKAIALANGSGGRVSDADNGEQRPVALDAEVAGTPAALADPAGFRGREESERRPHSSGAPGSAVELSDGPGRGVPTALVANALCEHLEESLARYRLPEESGQGAAGGEGLGERGLWAAEPGVGRVADGIPGRVDRLRGLGNAIVPQVAEAIFRAIIEVREAA